MTSGISAKGSTLGAGGSESGVASNHAPLPRAPGNGTKRSHQASIGTNFQEAGIAETPETSAGGVAAESSHPAMSSSVRTLILGIDYDGRIVQHDRNAGKILARKPEDLLGAQLIELTSAGAEGSSAHGNNDQGTAAQANAHAAGRPTAPPRWPGCSRRSVPIVRAAPCSRSTRAKAPRPRPW